MPQKNVWIVDDYRHAIFKFSNDGKKLLQTIGEPNVPGTDEKHFYRPTFMAWLPDGTFFVADGYQNTRVVKFDKDGKYLMTWGQRGTPPRRSVPATSTTSTASPSIRRRGACSSTIATTAACRCSTRTGSISTSGASDRGRSSDIHMFIITSDRFLWAADRGTSKLVKYSLDGKFLYSWGVWGEFPGALLGRARDERRSGRQRLHRRGRQRRRAEVHAAEGREPRVPARQAGEPGVEVMSTVGG